MIFAKKAFTAPGNHFLSEEGNRRGRGDPSSGLGPWPETEGLGEGRRGGFIKKKVRKTRIFRSSLFGYLPAFNIFFLPFKLMKHRVRKRFDNSIYRLVIRNIQGYGSFQVLPKDTQRAPGVCPQLDVLKQRVLNRLLQKQSKRTVKPVHWSIAWQTHKSSGLPHLDILIVFQKNIITPYTGFDYLIKDLKIAQRDVGDSIGLGHVWVTPYSSKKLNKAILQYGFKEDPAVITNLTLQSKQQLVRVHTLKADPYLYLYNQMCKDPLHFNVQQYVKRNQLSQYISSWSSIKTKLKDMQVAAANLKLKQKPGFKYINRALIQSKLSSTQLKIFDSWDGYQIIVDYLNQIPMYGGYRKMKTKNLLITGSASIGKTSLFHNPNHQPHQNPVQDYLAIYPMGMSTWFPAYRSGVYKLILWNQAKLTSYSYDTILKLLEGSFLDLPTKGGVAPKRDNPLIVMTSNLSLQQMIKVKFGYSEEYMQMARKNLAVRVQNVVIPENYNLFLLQKLISS